MSLQTENIEAIRSGYVWELQGELDETGDLIEAIKRLDYSPEDLECSPEKLRQLQLKAWEDFQATPADVYPIEYPLVAWA